MTDSFVNNEGFACKSIRLRMQKRMDILQHYGEFDAKWYQNTYLDVSTTGMNSFDHFSQFGAFIGRGFNSQNPDINDIPQLNEALRRPKKISYCIPIMNRPDDIRSTLQQNLIENLPFSDLIEFIIVFLDNDIETHSWVRENFQTELRNGYLRMIIDSSLDSWHFGKAKNSHLTVASGEVFSSLDGDNFVSLAETQQLLDISYEFGEKFVFHHFTGSWGDGSSGRISLSTEKYREIGYDSLFLPRQYDEVDVLLSVLTADQDVVFIRHPSENHALSSQRTREFIRLNQINNRVVQIDPPKRFQPLNPKNADYVSTDPILDAMQQYNQAASFYKNSFSQNVSKKYNDDLIHAKHRLLDALDAKSALNMIFKVEDVQRTSSVELTSKDIAMFACVKNDELFLTNFIDHHRKLGVSHFFLVDDSSETPVKDLLHFKDVSVFRPKVGSFKSSKTLWLQILIGAFVEKGGWAITADADELIDVPHGYSSFQELASFLQMSGKKYVPGILLDMVPGPDQIFSSIDDNIEDFTSIFDHHVWNEKSVDMAYVLSDPVKWGFGSYAALSWQIDLRYHAFGTIDSLRKISFFQPEPNLHLNQGFHTLHRTDKLRAPSADCWNTSEFLIIRHFKMVKLFSDEARQKIQNSSDVDGQYHARTSQNIQKIFGDSGNIEAIKALPLIDYKNSPLLHVKTSVYRY